MLKIQGRFHGVVTEVSRYGATGHVGKIDQEFEFNNSKLKLKRGDRASYTLAFNNVDHLYLNYHNVTQWIAVNVRKNRRRK